MMELIQQLVSTVGVNEQQAEGGVGLLMGLLKDKLSSGDFAQVAEAVPGVEGLIDAAPSAETGGGLGGLLGGVASAIGGSKAGDLASLASGFSKLDMDAGMIGQFIPVVVSFLQAKGGDGLSSLVSKVLQN